MKVLLLDNIDSFTWNLAQLIRSLGAHCDVVRADTVTIDDIRRINPDRIVISPGPGGPKDAKISLEAIQEFCVSTPILGVCLGHQCLAYAFGGPSYVGHAPKVMHGKTSEVRHDGRGILQRIPSPFTAARYHSLIVKKLPKDFLEMGTTDGGRTLMGMRHQTFPIFGVQFHPESFLTEHGSQLMKNFLRGRW